MMLLVLLVATLAMPVNYTAGTGYEHSHTIFQGIIDSLSGHPHHHLPVDGTSREPVTQYQGRVSAFGSAAIPLAMIVAADAVIAADTGATTDPDVPQLLGLSTPISSTSAVLGLGALVAALLAGAAVRPCWSQATRLAAWIAREEPPPPRLA